MRIILVLALLKSPFGPSYSDPFGIIEYTKSTISPMCISTNSPTSIVELTGSWSTLTETITSPNDSTKRNETSSTPRLPRWDIKTI